MTYTVSAEVTDVANLAVSDTRTITVLPSDRLIGLQSDYLGEAGEALPIQVIVTDPQGKLIRGRKLNLELQKQDYSRYTQVIEGSATDKNNVEYETIAQRSNFWQSAANRASSLLPRQAPIGFALILLMPPVKPLPPIPGFGSQAASAYSGAIAMTTIAWMSI
jgi:uncharacterized protein YfaS (alpha-2-macroglobulin family)